MSKVLAVLARGSKAIWAGILAGAGAYTVAYADNDVTSDEVGFIIATALVAAGAVYNVANGPAKDAE